MLLMLTLYRHEKEIRARAHPIAKGIFLSCDMLGTRVSNILRNYTKLFELCSINSSLIILSRERHKCHEVINDTLAPSHERISLTNNETLMNMMKEKDTDSNSKCFVTIWVLFETHSAISVSREQ